MGFPGPWYRLGMSLANAFILSVMAEQIVWAKSACHFLSHTIAVYSYGIHDNEPADVTQDISKYPLWALLALLYVIQFVADVFVWLAVIVKGKKHFLTFWMVTTITRNLFASFMDIKKEWGSTYSIASTLHRISAYLWGSILFGFIITSGFQALAKLISPSSDSLEAGEEDADREKLKPIAHGFSMLKTFYLREHPRQLAIVLVAADIVLNTHKSFYVPSTPFLLESKQLLAYKLPNEKALEISLFTVVFNLIGEWWLHKKNKSLRRLWVTGSVILVCVQLLILMYIVVDWSSHDSSDHTHMFRGYLFVSFVYIVFKTAVLYSYIKCSL